MTNDFFWIGPFASASANIQNFADGLYFAHLFHDSLKEREKIEKALTKAVEEDNTVLATTKQSELDYLDGIFRLTLEVHDPFDGIES